MGIVLGVALLLGGAMGFWRAFAHGIAVAKGAQCWSNVRQMARAAILYAQDGDDRLPLRDAWHEGLATVQPDVAAFRCPGALEPLRFDFSGYAYNGALSSSRFSRIVRPESVPAFYDSVSPLKNASDLATSLPSPGRHEGKNAVAYVDGHAAKIGSR